jgi:hypothetical protein
VQLRYGPFTIQLGRLTSTVVDRAAWFGQDGWPAWPYFAEEAERLFSFAEARGVFAMYLNELCGRRSQRDSAIAELRVAYFLDRNGFRIARWRPMGEGTHEGEFLAVGPNGEEIFVEVKSPAGKANSVNSKSEMVAPLRKSIKTARVGTSQMKGRLFSQ